MSLLSNEVKSFIECFLFGIGSYGHWNIKKKKNEINSFISFVNNCENFGPSELYKKLNNPLEKYFN